MRARVVAAVCLLVAASSGHAVAQEAPRLLTLRQAVDLARRHGPRVLDAQARIEESRIAHRIAESAFRPQLVPRMSGAIGGGDLANQSYGAELSQRFRWGTEISAAVGSTSSRNQLGTFYYTDTTLALTQPLYRGGADTRRRDADLTARSVEDARLDFALAEQALAVDVAAAYFAIVAQAQVIQVAAKAVDRSRHLLAVSEAKLEIGKVSQLDVLRARQLVREAEGRLTDARAVAEDARDQLRLLIGSADLEDFVVEPGIPAAANAPLETDGRSAHGDHAAVRRARAAAAAAEQQARDARKPLLPRVDFTLALTRRETGPNLRSSFGTDGFRVVPLIQMSLPLDRWGPAGGEDAARLELARRQRELQAAEMKAAIEVRRATRHRDRAINQLRDAEAGVSFASQQVDVARTRFERGLSNNLELVSAEADLLAAESRRIGAAAALAVAGLQLKALLGTLDLTEDFGR